MPQSRHPQKADEGHRDLKKINNQMKELKREKEKSGKTEGKVRLMSQDEAGFGRISRPRYCWCRSGIWPSVSCHYVREYRYAYGAVGPVNGASWHKSKDMIIPSNIALFYIPPYTSEMNPIEQIWKEICKRGVFNRLFPLCNRSLTVFSIPSLHSLPMSFPALLLGTDLLNLFKKD